MVSGGFLMNYKVLYRKYRPDGFDSLIGQKTCCGYIKKFYKKNKN